MSLLIVNAKSLRCLQIRTSILDGFDINRKMYEPRSGLRTKRDLVEEELELKEGRHRTQNYNNYNLLGKEKKTLKDRTFYSSRAGGKGYSDYANSIYPNRPYMWPPLRPMFSSIKYVAAVFFVIAFVDYEWASYHVKRLWREVWPEASTLPDEHPYESFNSESIPTEYEKAEYSAASNCKIEEPRRRKKKNGFRERRIIEYENRIRTYSTPDKIFRYFATLKVVNDDGSSEIFMTPEDFVRSLTPGVIQPRHYGLDKFKQTSAAQIREHRNKEMIFGWTGERGIISFGDYLFLMTLLSTPPSEFRLAFNVYDMNGDGELDNEEFARVQELVLSQSNVGQRHRDHVTGSGVFRKSISSVITNHFFGKDGDLKLSIERFLKFQQDLHADILKIEFDRRDPESNPVGIISEVSFAELLLLHSNLTEKRQARMLKRVKRKYKQILNKPGISFEEASNFFAFIYHIDKVDLALHFYKLAGKPLNKELLQKVAKKITGVELSDATVDVVVALFDENGDEQLSQKEFVALMKKRMHRGLERPKDTGFMRFLDALCECTKRQLWNIVD